MCQTCQPAANEAATPATEATEQPLRLETEVCSRCGGCGRMPFAVYGGLCFKCHGAGKVFTKKGAAANAWLVALRTRKASELKVGDHIREHRITLGGASYTVTGLITKIGMGDGTGSKWQDKATGEWKPYLEITTKTKEGEGITCTFPDSTFVKVFPREEARAQVRAAIEYQSTLTQAGKPRKNRKAQPAA